MRTVGTYAGFNLRREFSCRRQNQNADFARARDFCGGQSIEDGQGEAGGLAGSGLRAGHQVTTGEDDRNRLGLNRGGGFVAAIGDRTEDLGCETQFSKFHAGELQMFAMRVRNCKQLPRMHESVWANIQGYVNRVRRECLTHRTCAKTDEWRNEETG